MNCMRWVANCRCRSCWQPFRPTWKPWPRTRRTTRRTAPTSPYRRALTGIYARLASTAVALDQHQATRHCHRRSAALCRRHRVGDRSVRAGGFAQGARCGVAGWRPAAPVDPLAVGVFGFHLAPIDLRQNSDVPERTVADLLARAGVCAAYEKLPEEGRIGLPAGRNREPAAAVFG